MEPIVADVYRANRRIATLTQFSTETLFEYAVDSPIPGIRGGGVAYQLPWSVESLRTPGAFLPPFFANLLPEGFRLDALRSRLKSSSDDGFSMLLAVGADPIGDVQVLPQGKEPSFGYGAVIDVSASRLADLLQSDMEAARSIPGVQEKISEAMISLPIVANGSAVILKLTPPAYPKLVENEFFIMNLARSCGLAVADVNLVTDLDGQTALSVTRFDRTASGDRVHQEDLCQILGVYPGSKYSVTWRAIAEAIQLFCDAPQLQLRSLLRLIAFSYLVGNGDLHAKNVSVRQSPAGLCELTPAYDLLTTLPYPVDQRMAIKMDDKDDGLTRQGFVRFFERFGLSEKLIRREVEKICDLGTKGAKDFGQVGFDAKTTSHFLREIDLRARQLSK